MKSKASVIILVFFLSGVTYSCFDQCEDYKYYDYKGISIEVINELVESTDSLYFQVHFEESYFLAKKNRFRFFNSANAIACDKGWGGDKFPLARVSIKSDSDFNSEFPANTELSSIVKVRGTNSNGQYVLDFIDQFEPTQINNGHFYIILRPESDKVHKLTVEFEKSNGVVNSTISEQIEWE